MKGKEGEANGSGERGKLREGRMRKGGEWRVRRNGGKGEGKWSKTPVEGWEQKYEERGGG